MVIGFLRGAVSRSNRIKFVVHLAMPGVVGKSLIIPQIPCIIFDIVQQFKLLNLAGKCVIKGESMENKSEQHYSEIGRLHGLLSTQKQAYQSQPMPSAQQRINALKALKHALLIHRSQLLQAVDKDFGGRSHDETDFAELLPCVMSIDFTVKHLRAWMKVSRRHRGWLFFPGSNQVHYQPLGVVGIMVPWNYPVQLSILPLVSVLAAGNRAIIKLSEFSPATNQVIKQLLANCFSEEQVAIVEGEVEIASAFAGQAWDHLIFTGSTAVGRTVMSAAAQNLTPVTLELGGKSPALVTSNTDISIAAERICFGKSLNAGQTCIAPDYVLLPEGQQEAFITAYHSAFKKLYPSLKNNPDYTAIVNERQWQRLGGLLADAQAKGAVITEINPDKENLDGSRKMAPRLIMQVQDDMQIMQEELFGPILPLITYRTFNEALEYINARPRPLALYLFSQNKKEQQHVLTHTHAGGVTINSTLFHVVQDDLPFGGIGASGMGHYHGYEGFLALSKAKSVHVKGRIDFTFMIYPPYGGRIQRFIKRWFMRV
jgi:coniferyl-aldehyde dehydrogenase